MTKERIEKELTKVREQLAGLQARQKDLEEQLQHPFLYPKWIGSDAFDC